ncbi:HD domain-containing protein [Niveibacterium umoris]|uniref:HD-GYP domain-containing protein (C-di-GMP phosphodiesterase class II) n=1 Tax=Niveibacterium umoris TaxID=1193620 RepID=A0A840BJ67_9RHOO|nr:HD domain-containing phosphohydrolase [Niveibacterium umoris]MBB4013591.1 HD-GYP domain-containing protein (c-di-GMP phosphodiesterase class II) [Niveibacterium umoris]
MQVMLADMVFALSEAVDLVGVDDDLHGRRVAVMAAECARELGYDTAHRWRLLHAGMLHDCGVSSTRVHANLVNEFDWHGAQAHCVLGEALLASIPVLADLAPIVRWHHTHWSAMPPGLDPDVARDANLIYLVDRVDALTAPSYGAPDYLLAKEASRQRIAAASGREFCPALVDAFLAVSRREAFWLTLERRHLTRYLNHAAAESLQGELDLAGMLALARAFSQIVDAKSPFTAEHSLGVARLALHLAQRAGLDQPTCARIEIAALLHDIGKLRVPDEVLEKPGPLDPQQRASMLCHSFETYQILSAIRGFDDIALWASCHHEKLDGSGYPFHFEAGEIPLPARIIAVADIAQALVQNRPYRGSMPDDAVMAHLQKLVANGLLDGEVVGLLDADCAASLAIARGAAASALH